MRLPPATVWVSLLGFIAAAFAAAAIGGTATASSVREWYPLLAKLEARKLPARLKRLGASNWLQATLEVKAPSTDGFGMNGSAMFIINPPWTLEKTLRETLPCLTSLLAQGDGAKFIIESQTQ